MRSGDLRTGLGMKEFIDLKFTEKKDVEKVKQFGPFLNNHVI